jgi:hypothetical protein
LKKIGISDLREIHILDNFVATTPSVTRALCRARSASP